MKRFLSVVAVLAVLAIALVGGALLWKRNSSPSAPPPPPPARSAGGKIYDKWCRDCHSTPQGPGSIALQRKYKDAVPAVLEQRSDLSPELVKLVVRQGMSFMPSFRKTEISDAELALLADYLVSAHKQAQPATKQP